MRQRCAPLLLMLALARVAPRGASLTSLMPHTMLTCSSSRASWPFITLHQLRNLFITHRGDNPSLPGPSQAAAAASMLHSPAQWPAFYDLHHRRRQMEQTAIGMAAWRSAVMAKPANAGAAEAGEREALGSSNSEEEEEEEDV